MIKEIHKIINNIFYLNEGFNIFENCKGWININYKNDEFIIIYINKKDKSIIIYYYYDSNSLEFINKYNIKNKNRYYMYMNISNKLKWLYEKKMIQNDKKDDHLNLFNIMFPI